MEEIWKDIKGYEGLYQVSNLGRVKSLPRVVNHGNYVYKRRGRIKLSFNSKGYDFIKLHKDTHRKVYLVHRLVAEAFIPNPNNFAVVNHKDGVKTNNFVDNLEWCTASDNTKHAIHTGLLPIEQIRMNGSKSKDVCAIRVLCEDTNQVFPSIVDAKKYFRIQSIQTNIHKHERTHNGRGWLFSIVSEEYYQEHKDDIVDIDICEQVHNDIRSRIGNQGKPIQVYCVEKNKMYSSINSAAKENNLDIRAIQFAISENRKTKGLTFKIIQN